MRTFDQTKADLAAMGVEYSEIVDDSAGKVACMALAGESTIGCEYMVGDEAGASLARTTTVVAVRHRWPNGFEVKS